MNHLIIPRRLFQSMMDTIGAYPTESGGAFAISEGAMSDYYFDLEAGVGQRFYRPTTDAITNQAVQWYRSSQAFGGFIHSHAASYTMLSAMDIVAAEMTMGANNLLSLYMGVICEKRLYLYRVVAPCGQGHSTVESCRFTIV